MTQPSALQDRWKALAPREQNLVLAAGTVVALALLIRRDLKSVKAKTSPLWKS